MPPVVPGVHFLGDDIRLFADAASEELRLLENGRADFVEVVGAENIAHRRFDEVP